ncbi:hypothetical protein, partial [Collinsella sp. LCP21S3_C7]
MNRKLNAAITAGLSLSMVLGSTPVAAIAAETTQDTSGEAAAAAATGVKDVLYFANGGVFVDGNVTLQGVTDSDGVARQPLAPT